jgi:hypothetical protein
MKFAATSCRQCQWWEKSAYLLGAFFIVFLIVHATENYTTAIDLALSFVFTFVLVWVIWAVKTFYDMLCWWKDIQKDIVVISNLLIETKQDIHDIKNLKEEANGISSR